VPGGPTDVSSIIRDNAIKLSERRVRPTHPLSTQRQLHQKCAWDAPYARLLADQGSTNHYIYLPRFEGM
jgi:hypothetical protein